MDKIELIRKIKSELKSLLSGSEMKFVEAKCGDLMINTPAETFEVGAEVYSTDVDGNNVPLADGEYTLDNGLKLVVSAGKVEAIAKTDAEMPAEEASDASGVEVEVEAVEAPVAPEAPVETPEAEDIKEAADLTAILDRLAKLEELVASLTSANAKLESEVKEFASIPAENAIEVNVAEFKNLDEKLSSDIDILDLRAKARKNR